MIFMSSRRLLVLVVGSVQCVALAVAEPAIEKDPLLPRALNHTAINTQIRTGNAVLQMSNNWGRLSAGTRLTGTYRVEGGGLSICVENVNFPGGHREHAADGHCLARAIPASDAIIERGTNDHVIIPQAQPFRLYDLPLHWGMAGMDG